MWVIAKIKSNQFYLVKKHLTEILGSMPRSYVPRLKLYKFCRNKKTKKIFNLLGDYVFFYHANFKKPEIINLLNFVKGSKYFLKNFIETQSDIKNFISSCEINQDQDGYLKSNFLNICENFKYKFISGPFQNLIFEVLEKEKNKINILIGNVKTTLRNNSDYIFNKV